MTVKEPTRKLVDGYYKSIVRELGLESVLKAVTGDELEDHSLEVSEGILIEEVLDEAPEDYIFETINRHPVEYLILVL